MRPSFVRRYAVQIVAVTVAVVGIVALGVLSRPSGGSGGSAVVRSPVTARATATVDPRVEEVKAVARKYLQAYWESAKTGDTSAVDALTEKDSPAYGSAADAASTSREDHRTFASSNVDIDESTWHVNVTAALATVHVVFQLYGHYAEWPSLKPIETDHLTPSYPIDFQMRITSNQWVIFKVN